MELIKKMYLQATSNKFDLEVTRGIMSFNTVSGIKIRFHKKKIFVFRGDGASVADNVTSYSFGIGNPVSFS